MMFDGCEAHAVFPSALNRRAQCWLPKPTGFGEAGFEYTAVGKRVSCSLW